MINGKYYIGKHQTKNLNDNYLGSGKLLIRAIKKYGRENFKKEILEIYDNEADMNAAEKRLVVICEQSYNLCDGGHGGFGYINRNGLNRYSTGFLITSNQKKGSLTFLNKLESDPDFKNAFSKKISSSVKRYYENRSGTFKGKNHSSATKLLISLSSKTTSLGENNSQFGTMWVTNGVKNTKIKKTEIIPEGWKRGRSMNQMIETFVCMP